MATSKVNANYPKCTTCIKNDCFAGMVNHESRRAEYRTECLFGCGCLKFEEASLEVTQIAKEVLKGK